MEAPEPTLILRESFISLKSRHKTDLCKATKMDEFGVGGLCLKFKSNHICSIHFTGQEMKAQPSKPQEDRIISPQEAEERKEKQAGTYNVRHLSSSKAGCI